MRLVAVSTVKNEADVIEAFVRHTAAWVDVHLVFDHASTDGTREILAALAREGLSIKLFTDDEVGKQQQARTQRLTETALTEEHADWIIPLDADEFIVAPDRPALEAALAAANPEQPLSLFMGNYFPHPSDEIGEANPALRLRHRVSIGEGSKKIFLPRALALAPNVTMVKGSHALMRGDRVIADQPAPDHLWLAHIPQRSVSQQLLRIVTGHLQKVGAGRQQATEDVHYAPLYRYLARSPELFPATLPGYPDRVHPDPIPYRGGPLRFTPADRSESWPRVVRALLPFLEDLAASHGQFRDAQIAQPEARALDSFRALPLGAVADLAHGFDGEFSGFVCPQGLGPPEGPFPLLMLPRFRWGFAPSTVLDFVSAEARTGTLEWIAQTQFGAQVVHVECNGTVLTSCFMNRQHVPEKFSQSLPLVAGANRVVLHYESSITTAQDPRRLALAFMSLRIW